MRVCFRYLAYLFILIAFSSAHAGSYDDFFIDLENDDASTVTRLLERGFDPNTPDPKGRTPLAMALQGDSLKVAEALWRHPELKVDQVNAAGETALMLAALKARLDWVQRLVERGAKIDREGWTPLHYAATGSGDASVLRWLLGHGAALEARAPNGATPLMMAAGYGSEANVEALLKAGASLRATSDQGMTAAAFARKVGRDSLAQRLQ